MIARCCFVIKPYVAMMGDIIYKRQEVGREMYIIVEGTVALEMANWTMKRRKNSFFGEGAISKDNVRRDHTAMADEDCELGFITRDDVMSIGEAYPSLLKKLAAIKDRRHELEEQRLSELLDSTGPCSRNPPL